MPGSKLQFTYRYKNTTKKTMKFRVLRQVVDKDGKAVINRPGAIVLKPGEVFKRVVTEVLPPKLAAGTYTSRIQLFDSKTKALVDENSFAIKVEAKAAKPVILKQGSRGSAVKQLQLRLQELGELSIKIKANGIFGPATRKALQAFQKANDLAPTGKTDTATTDALNR